MTQGISVTEGGESRWRVWYTERLFTRVRQITLTILCRERASYIIKSIHVFNAERCRDALISLGINGTCGLGMEERKYLEICVFRTLKVVWWSSLLWDSICPPCACYIQVIPWIYHQLETMVGVCNVWNIGLSFLSCKILILVGVIQTNFKSLVTSINGLRWSLAWQILMLWFYPNSQVYAYVSLHICWCIGIL